MFPGWTHDAYNSVKILLISSSPHKEASKTYLLAGEVVAGLAREGADVEAIHVDDYRVSFCKHCQACHKQLLHCSVNDDVPLILQKMLDADGILLASPNYIRQVTASMKAIFDRCVHFIHCKRLWGKYVAGVVTSGSGQDQEVVDYIKLYAHACGAQYSGSVSSAAHLVEKKKEQALQLARDFALDIRHQRAYPDQIKILEAGREHFKRIIQMRKDEWPGEYQYWKERGWLPEGQV
jgi:multimeric flavodoxin WrbA